MMVEVVAMVRPVRRLPAQYVDEQLSRSIKAVFALRKILSPSDMELLNDALHCYANHPDWWGCDEEFDEAMIFALCFDMAGYNTLKDEYNLLSSWELPGNE